MTKAVLICGDASEHAVSPPSDWVIAKHISFGDGEEKIRASLLTFGAAILGEMPDDERNRVLRLCFETNAAVYLSPKQRDVKGGDNTAFFLPASGFSLRQKATKRCFDIIFGIIALLLSSPIMLVTAIAVKLCDGGPVFFKQKRFTIDGRKFEILKFRSMTPDAEKNGTPTPATANDPRITAVGKFIRSTGIDELPQILNILSGDMSFVGPRPERVENVIAYCENLPEFAYRMKVKSGLTGYAQIYGRYDTPPYQKLRLDLTYIEKYSFWLDVKLIILTFGAVFKRRMQ